MNIVILGAGEIGSYVASMLAQEEHNVVLIDKDVKRLEKLSRDIDVATLPGHASDWKLFKQLIDNAPDFFIALTGNDEANLIACAITKNLGYPKTICRIGEISYLNRSRLDFGRLFYVDYFIGAEVIAAHEILKSLISPSDLLTEDFAHGSIQMRTIVLPANWEKHNVQIKDLNLPEEMILGLIRRASENSENKEDLKEDEYIFPHGNDFLHPCDHITVVGEANAMSHLHEIFNVPHKAIQSVVIIGGSSVAMHLTEILQKLKVYVKIIEKDEKKCDDLAEMFPKATIINHDARDLNFLLSEKVQDAEAFITTMREDDENLLVASLGKEAGSGKVVSLISDSALAPVLKKLNISYAVSEKVNLSNRILSIVHAQSILSISSIADNHANVIEIKVSEDSQLIGIPLKDLSTYLPRDLLICVIENKGKVLIGKGNRILSPNDTIILITSPTHIHELQHLF